MQTSDIKSIKKSELNLDDDDNKIYSPDRCSSQDLNQLMCFLKNAMFSKYISSNLIEKVEQAWILYEKRIDKFLKEKHLHMTCSQIRPQIAISLEELAKYQQKNIDTYQRTIEILCSTHKQLNNNDKYSVPTQTNQHLPTNSGSVRVPKIPRCTNRSRVTNAYYNHDIEESNDSTRNKIGNQELSLLSMSSTQHNHRHCIFQHGEILPFDPNTNIRTIKMTYLCNNSKKSKQKNEI